MAKLIHNPETGEYRYKAADGSWQPARKAVNPDTNELRVNDGTNWVVPPAPPVGAPSFGDSPTLEPSQDTTVTPGSPLPERVSRAPGGGSRAAQGNRGKRSYSRGRGNPEGHGLKEIDDFVRSAANVLPWVDETAALATTATGLGGQAGPDASYEENLAAERGRDEAIPTGTKVAGTLGGLALTLPMIAMRVPSLLRGASPTISSIAPRAAFEGGFYGGLYGSGAAEGDTLTDRAEGALRGAGMGALTAGALGVGGGAIAGAVNRSAQSAAAPTAQQTLSKAGQAYEAVRQSGVAVQPQVFSRLTQDLRRLAAREGFDPKLYGKVNKALKRMDEAAKSGKPISFAELDILRNFWRKAAGSRDPQQGRLGGELQKGFEAAIAGLDDVQTVGGNLAAAQTGQATANTLYRQGKSAQTIEQTIAKARQTASGPNSQGLQKAIQGEFQRLLQNERKMRFFSEAEKEMVRKVAQGGAGQNLAKMMGSMALSPSFMGMLSPMMSSGAGGALGFAAGGPAGAAIGAAGAPLVGAMARGIGGRLASGSANRALQSFRQGPTAVPQQSYPTPFIRQLLQQSVVGSSSQAAPRAQRR